MFDHATPAELDAMEKSYVEGLTAFAERIANTTRDYGDYTIVCNSMHTIQGLTAKVRSLQAKIDSLERRVQ